MTKKLKIVKKKCGVCGKLKSIDQFWVRSDNKKPRNTCKECQKIQSIKNKKYYDKKTKNSQEKN